MKIKSGLGVIVKFQDNLIATIAFGMPKTQEQIIDFGIKIIKKTADFEVAMRAWYDRPAIDKT